MSETGELNYNGYKGSAEFSVDDGLWHGKISGIKDIVTYEAMSFEDLKEEFCIAVDDWIETRKNIVKT